MAPGVNEPRPLEQVNRPDEWKIEQGLAGAKLPFLDQTGDVTVEIMPGEEPPSWEDDSSVEVAREKAEFFKIEREGWKG